MDLDSLYSTAREGQKESVDQLFSHLSVRFRAIANLKIGNAQDAEEIAQEALMTISREYAQLNVTTSFKAWAYKVFDNKILGYIGTKKRRGKYDSPAQVGETARAGLTGDNPGLKSQLSECLSKIRAANRRYARILALHYQGYQTEEICARLGINPPNLYMILSRARVVLKRCLQTGEVTP
ncbi:MAG: RNA polymerase sigma factor [Candidatus Zixiibacteriota bacterium]|nr:MAG: RNA polymerase sigma factor [candidate division Zixibacteria bacterium]